MKANRAFKDMAEVMKVSVVSLKKLHGIRWLASQARAVQAILRNYQPLVAHFENVALAAVGSSMTTTSPSSAFLNLKVSQSWKIGDGA